MAIFKVVVSGDDVPATQTPNTPTPLVYEFEIDAKNWEDALAQAPGRWREKTGETGDPKYVQPLPGHRVDDLLKG